MIMRRRLSAAAVVLGAVSVISALVAAACSSGGNNYVAQGSSSGPKSTAPCSTTLSCNNPTLKVLFSPMYSAYITDDHDAHTFQIPAVVSGVDPASVTWGVSDPTAIDCQTDPSSGGVMITVQKAMNVTIVAQSGNACGQSTLNVTPATDMQWQRGNARYNSDVPLYGGCIGLGKHYPDGGAGACPTEGPACVLCHGANAPKNPYFRDVAHTPEQTGGFTDQDLIDIVVNGQVPPGGYFDPTIISYPSWQVFHKWSDIKGDDQQAMVVYLRSLLPLPQRGANFGGADLDGGGADATQGDGGGMPPPMLDASADASATCGAQTCSGGEVCCVTAGSATPDSGLAGSCSSASACSGISLACNGAQDCPMGQVCCAGTSGTTTFATCQASCDSSQQQVCQKPHECSMGEGCRLYPYWGGIQVCEGLKDAGHEGGHKDATVDDASGE
jgi:hypothetical protein